MKQFNNSTIKQPISLFIYILVVLILHSTFSFSQSNTDSLIQNLKFKIVNSKDDTTRIKLLGKIGIAYHDAPESLPYYEEALQLSKKINNKTLEATCYNDIGIVQRNQGNYDVAINYYLQSLKIYEELNMEHPDDLGNKTGIANCLNNIGNVYRFQGDYDQAINYYLQSLKIYEELNNKTGIANCLNNIGNVYHIQGDYDQAINNYLQSLKIYEELNMEHPDNLGNKAGIAKSLNNIGVVYQDQGDYTSAINNYLQSLKIKEELNDKTGIAMSLNNIGVVYYFRNKKDSALIYFKNSLKIEEEIGNKDGIARSLSNIGELYTEQASAASSDANRKHLYFEALQYLDSSLVIAKEIGKKFGIMNAGANLAGTYEKLGRYDTAFSYHKLSSQYRDSLLNEEQSKEIGKLEASYEYEKEETEKKRITETAARIQQEEKERADNIQYIGIVIFLVLVFAGIIVLARRLIKPVKGNRDGIFGKDTISARYASVLEGSSWVAFVLLFEFVLILFDSRIEALTGNIPVWKVLLNCLIAGGLFPVQIFLEKLLKKGLGITAPVPASGHAPLSKGTFLFSMLLAMSLGQPLSFVSSQTSLGFLYFITTGFTEDKNPNPEYSGQNDSTVPNPNNLTIQQFNNNTIDSLKHELKIVKHACPEPCLGDTTRIKLLLKIGKTYNHTPESLPYYEEALQLSKKINNKTMEADCYIYIGSVQQNQGNYDVAIKYYLQSLKIKKKLNNKAGIAMCLNNIGNIYQYQGDYTSAINNYLQSLKIKKKLNNKAGIAMCLNNIGGVYRLQGDYTLAIKNYLQSLKIDEELNNKAGIASSLNNIGVVYYFRGKKDSALIYFKSSLKIDEEIGNKEGIAIKLSNIGELYAEQAEYKESLQYLDGSLAIAKEIDAKYIIMTASENLANTYSKQNKYETACSHYKVFRTYKDSIFNEEKSKEISKLQTKHDLEMSAINLRHKQEEAARIAAEEQELRDKIQYSCITISGFVLIGLLLLLSNFILPVWLIELLTYIPFLLLFETLLSILDPLVASYTDTSPAYTLIVNGVLAVGLYPLHNFIESRLKRRFYWKKRKKVLKKRK